MPGARLRARPFAGPSRHRGDLSRPARRATGYRATRNHDALRLQPRAERRGYDECGGDAVASCSASSSLATSSRVIASARDGRPRGRLSEIAEPVSQISTRTLSRFGNSPERVSVNVPEAFPVLLLEAGGARGADWGAAQAPHRPGWADGARRDALRRAGCAGAQHIDAHASVERERAVAGAPRLGRGALSRARRCRSR